jgi:hypothetical protein
VKLKPQYFLNFEIDEIQPAWEANIKRAQGVPSNANSQAPAEYYTEECGGLQTRFT